MISHRLDLTLTGGVEARLVLTGRGSAASGGSSRSPYSFANLASHVGDEAGAVTANRARLAQELGVEVAQMTFMHPDHGRGVARVSTGTGIEPGAELAGVDALVTDRPGIALVALAADCVPVLLVDHARGVVAAVHSGWRGLWVDVVGAALEEMVAAGASPADTTAHLGPAICGRCYPVPAERVALVSADHPAAVTTAADGQPALDVRAGLVARLAGLGIPSHLVGGCTAEDEGLYSHRRDGRTGRQAGAVVLRGAAA